MSFTLRSVKVPPNSASLEEARARVFDFFRTACRSIPQIMDIYNLQDVVTVSQLRSTIASEIRKNSQITNPKVHSLSLFLSLSLSIYMLMLLCSSCCSTFHQLELILKFLLNFGSLSFLVGNSIYGIMKLAK